MKKTLATIIAALAVMTSIPTMPAQALDPPMKGDLNTDFKVNMADLILMQRYGVCASRLRWRWVSCALVTL